MRKIFLFSLAAILLVSATSCEKTAGEDFGEGGSCGLPHNAAPSALQGGWANGFSNRTQIIDAYNGNILGYTWSSAKYFHFTSDGKGADFYYMAKGQFAQTATKVKGTIEFDEGSTSESGSFTFHACKGHYKSWGNPSIDRDATDEELRNNLTGKYYYEMQGEWLRISPGGPVNQFTTSFRKVD